VWLFMFVHSLQERARAGSVASMQSSAMQSSQPPCETTEVRSLLYPTCRHQPKLPLGIYVDATARKRRNLHN